MKKKDWFYNVAISVVAIGIMVVIVFKFVLPEKSRQGGFAIKEFEKIAVMDLNGNKLQLAALVSKDLSTYCFLKIHQTVTADYTCCNIGSNRNCSSKEFRIKCCSSSGSKRTWSLWRYVLVSIDFDYYLRLCGSPAVMEVKS